MSERRKESNDGCFEVGCGCLEALVAILVVAIFFWFEKRRTA